MAAVGDVMMVYIYGDDQHTIMYTPDVGRCREVS